MSVNVTRDMQILLSSDGSYKVIDELGQVDAAQERVAQSAKKLGKETDSLSGFVREQKKEQRMQSFLFRESKDAINAVMFATMGLVSATGNENKEISKLNSALVSGYASFQAVDFMMAAFGVTTGGVSMAIAAAVAVGAGLLSFFRDTEDAAKKSREEIEKYQKSIEDWTGRLKGTNDANRTFVAGEKELFERRIAALKAYVAFAESGTKGPYYTGDRNEASYIESVTLKYKDRKNALSLIKQELSDMVYQYNILAAAAINFVNVIPDKVTYDNGIAAMRGLMMGPTGTIQIPTQISPVKTGYWSMKDVMKSAEIKEGEDAWYDIARNFSRDFGQTMADEGMTAMEKIFGRANSLGQKLLYSLFGGMAQKGGEALSGWALGALESMFWLDRRPGPAATPAIGTAGGVTVNYYISAVDAKDVHRHLSDPATAMMYAQKMSDMIRMGKVVVD